MATGEETAKASGSDQAASPWAAALSKLREWDPAWAEQAVKLTTNPWTEGANGRRVHRRFDVRVEASSGSTACEKPRAHLPATVRSG